MTIRGRIRASIRQAEDELVHETDEVNKFALWEQLKNLYKRLRRYPSTGEDEE